jgi:uncharacterized membrane protein
MPNIIFAGFNINKALDEIINSKELNGDEKIILLTISFYHKGLIENNPSMTLSIDNISELVGCSKTTAGRIMKKLINKGYIDVIRKGQGNANIYVFKGWRKWQ